MQLNQEPTYPLWLKGLPDGPDKPGEGNPDISLEQDSGHGERKLVCKTCRLVITRSDLGMRIDGQHRHVFFNPYGMVFELGCFASAKNVVPAGPKTDEFTWFPGYVWEVMACAGCTTQLGWRYTGEGSGFYGLILNTLTEEEGRKV